MALGHDEFGAAGRAGHDIELIHERLHQKHPAAGIAQDIFIVAGIGNILDAKARSLVRHVDHQFLREQFEDHVDFSLAPLFVAVLKGVHDAFVHRQADLVLIVLAKSGRAATRIPISSARAMLSINVSRTTSIR